MKFSLPAVLALATSLAFPVSADVGIEQEIAIGKRSAANVEASMGVDRNPELQRRLLRIAQPMARVSGRTDINYHFQVLNSDALNAMALPGGYIYVTRGALNKLSDGQLAFVIGHELAHVTCRHSIKKMATSQWGQLGVAILFGLGQGQQAGQMAQVAQQVVRSRFSQEDESEADRLGAEMLVRSGVDPAYTLLTLQALAKQRNGGMPQFVNAIRGSHPLPSQRIEAARNFIPTLSFGPQQTLCHALVDAAGLTQEAELDTLLAGSEAPQGSLILHSPVGESASALEKRLLSEELPRRLQSQPGVRHFGLRWQRLPDQSKTVWIVLR